MPGKKGGKPGHHKPYKGPWPEQHTAIPGRKPEGGKVTTRPTLKAPRTRHRSTRSRRKRRSDAGFRPRHPESILGGLHGNNLVLRSAKNRGRGPPDGHPEMHSG